MLTLCVHAPQAQANKHRFIVLGIDSHKLYNWHEAYNGAPATDDYYHTLVREEAHQNRRRAVLRQQFAWPCERHVKQECSL